MKSLLIVCLLLFSASFALAHDADEHDIAQLNIYGGNVKPPLDQPHGVSVTNEGEVTQYDQTSTKTIARLKNERRKAIESDVYAIFPTGALVDLDPKAPFCADQPTMDYNIIKLDGQVLTLIHYFHCHTFMATGAGVSARALRLKTLLDGVLALTQFGD